MIHTWYQTGTWLLQVYFLIDVTWIHTGYQLNSFQNIYLVQLYTRRIQDVCMPRSRAGRGRRRLAFWKYLVYICIHAYISWYICCKCVSICIFFHYTSLSLWKQLSTNWIQFRCSWNCLFSQVLNIWPRRPARSGPLGAPGPGSAGRACRLVVSYFFGSMHFVHFSISFLRQGEGRYILYISECTSDLLLCIFS